MKVEWKAEELANRLYSEMQLDRVAVIKCNSAGDTIGDQFELRFDRERICKHYNIQAEFNFKTGEVENRCVGCGIKIDIGIRVEDPLAEVEGITNEKG